MTISEQTGDERDGIVDANLTWSNLPITRLSEESAAWDSLNAQGANLPFLDSAFFGFLSSEFCTGDERILLCRAGEVPVACGIFERTKRGGWRTIQPSQAPLGAWLQRSDLPISGLMASLRRALRGPTFVLSLSQQDPGVLPRPHKDQRLKTLNYIDTARITVEGRFDDYWSARGKNLRQNLRRSANRLKNADRVPRLEIVTHRSDVSRAIAEYGLLESAGWKSEQGTAIHPDNSQGRFYSALFDYYSARDEAIVFQYFFNETLVASDLCLQRDGVLVILKTAYAEEERKSSPAMLMRKESFDYIFDSGKFRRIEFYGKVMEWHTRWSSEIRGLYHVNYYRSGLVAKLSTAISRGN